MCGIFGIYKHPGSPSKYDYRPLIDAFYKNTAERGRDAAGYAYTVYKTVEKKWYLVWKKNGIDPDEWVKQKYNDDIDLAFSMFIGHTRHGTQGSPKDNRNNHPLIADDIIYFALVHNGIVSSKYTGKRPLNAEVDTAVLRATITDKLEEKKSFSDSVKETVEELSGSMTTAIISSTYPHTLFLTKVNNPLWLAYLPTLKITVFASTEEILIKTLTEFFPKFMTVFPPYYVYDVPADSQVIVSSEDIKLLKLDRKIKSYVTDYDWRNKQWDSCGATSYGGYSYQKKTKRQKVDTRAGTTTSYTGKGLRDSHLYDQGDKVKITKPGKFLGLVGKVREVGYYKSGFVYDVAIKEKGVVTSVSVKEDDLDYYYTSTLTPPDLKESDDVRIIAGENKGVEGTIVATYYTDGRRTATVRSRANKFYYQVPMGNMISVREIKSKHPTLRMGTVVKIISGLPRYIGKLGEISSQRYDDKGISSYSVKIIDLGVHVDAAPQDLEVVAITPKESFQSNDIVEVLKESSTHVGRRGKVSFVLADGRIGVLFEEKDNKTSIFNFVSSELSLVKEKEAILKGETVKVVGGLHDGLIGKVVHIVPSTATTLKQYDVEFVTPDGTVIATFYAENLELVEEEEVEELVVPLMVGDRVKVIHGDVHFGQTGIVKTILTGAKKVVVEFTGQDNQVSIRLFLRSDLELVDNEDVEESKTILLPGDTVRVVNDLIHAGKIGKVEYQYFVNGSDRAFVKFETSDIKISTSFLVSDLERIEDKEPPDWLRVGQRVRVVSGGAVGTEGVIVSQLPPQDDKINRYDVKLDTPVDLVASFLETDLESLEEEPEEEPDNIYEVDMPVLITGGHWKGNFGVIEDTRKVGKHTVYTIINYTNGQKYLNVREKDIELDEIAYDEMLEEQEFQEHDTELDDIEEERRKMGLMGRGRAVSDIEAGDYVQIKSYESLPPDEQTPEAKAELENVDGIMGHVDVVDTTVDGQVWIEIDNIPGSCFRPSWLRKVIPKHDSGYPPGYPAGDTGYDIV